MDIGALDAAMLAWLESVRVWLLGQDWLAFAREWIKSAAPWAIWVLVVSPMAAVILLVGFAWPDRKS